MAKQTVILKLTTTGETDNWGKPIFQNPKTINNCVVQPQTIYSGSNNDRQIVANATVYFYTGITDPMPKLTRDNVGSIITFEDHDYTVTQISDNRNPFSNDVWSYEVGVI